MGRYRALEICRNITQTLSKELHATCTQFLNPMFDKPKVSKSILKKQRKDLMKKYNINKEEL